MNYKISRGSPISFSADVMSGLAADASAVAAHLRRITTPGERERPAQNEPIAAILTVTPRAASAQWPEGWTVFLDSTSTKALPLGRYRLDLVTTVAGQNWNPPTGVVIEIVEPATVL